MYDSRVEIGQERVLQTVDLSAQGCDKVHLIVASDPQRNFHQLVITTILTTSQHPIYQGQRSVTSAVTLIQEEDNVYLFIAQKLNKLNYIAQNRGTLTAHHFAVVANLLFINFPPHCKMSCSRQTL